MYEDAGICLYRFSGQRKVNVNKGDIDGAGLDRTGAHSFDSVRGR